MNEHDVQPITDSSVDDIDHLFERYEQQYTKNTKWLTDDNAQISESELSHLLSQPLSQKSDSISSHITSDDIVNVVENIVAESSRQLDEQNIDNASSNKNETQRTVVVVVTTNVYNINTNGPMSSVQNEQTAKQQHAWLSFGNPLLLIDKIQSIQNNDENSMNSDILPAEQRNTIFAIADDLNNNQIRNPIRDYILSNSNVQEIMAEKSTKA